MTPPASAAASEDAAALAQSRPLDREGTIRDWLVLEPAVYQPAWPPGVETLDGRTLPGEPTLRPSEGDQAQVGEMKLTWRRHRALGPTIDLAAATGADESAATLLAFVEPVAARREWLNGHAVVWRSLRADEAALDLNALARRHEAIVGPTQLAAHDGEIINGVTWAAAHLESARERRDVAVEPAANDLDKALLDSEEVLRQGEPGGLERLRKTARVLLRKGRTLLTLESLNAARRWQALVRVLGPDGRAAGGVTVVLAPGTPSFVAG